MQAILKAENETQRLEVYQDEDAQNPRTEFDNVGKMICFHNRYGLGDKHDFRTPADFESWYKGHKRNIAVILPLYLLEHSGLTMSTGSFGDPWDSGQVGYIYVTKAQVRKEWKGDIEAAKKYLIAEVKTYDQYLTGEVYGYTLKSKAVCPTCGRENEDNTEDSCWGFYGYENLKEDLIGNGVSKELVNTLA